MRNSLFGAALVCALAVPFLHSQTQSVTPQMTAVEPNSGKAGDVLTVTGNNLDDKVVAEVYLTDGKADVKMIITEQNATSVKLRIPPGAKAGRYALMVLTKGTEPKFIEEPVKVTVEASGIPSTS